MTKYYYQSFRQNNSQYGNVTGVQVYSHSEESLPYATWSSRVANFSTQLALLRTTVTEYFPASSPTVHIVNRPARVRVYAGNSSTGSCQSEVRSVYDNADGNYQAAPSKGLLTKTEQALNACADTPLNVPQYDAGWIVTRMAYDSYGNQTTVNRTGIDSSKNDIITTVYDATYHLFPIEQYKNANSLFKETALYYGVNGLGVSDTKAAWGALQEHCGVNEVCTHQAYDEFGRRVKRWDYNASWGATPNVQWYYTAYGNGQSGNTVSEVHSPSSEGNFVRQIYNGLGQLIQTQTPYQDWAATNGQEILVDYAYNAQGQQTQVSVPHLLAKYSSGDKRRPANFSPGVTTTLYDTLGRATQSTAPNGDLTLYSYNGRANAVTAKGRNGDPDKKLTRQRVNGLGYLESTRTEYLSGATWVIDAEVLLTHDVKGNLQQVTHPNGLGNTTLTYDLAGRKTGINDIDLGVWSYAYDRQGNLTRQTDARGKAVCLHYDNLGRLVGKEFRIDNGSPTLCNNPSYDVSFSYDGGHSASNRSRGQLTQTRYTNSSYQKDWVYNSQGLLGQETVTMPIAGWADANTTSYGYDAYQRLSTTTYPLDNEVVTISYNGMGLPQQLSSNQLGTIVDSASYDAAGRLVQLHTTKNGLWRNAVYVPFNQQNSQGGQLGSLWIGSTNNLSSPTAYDRQKFDYYYDSFGNIKIRDEGATAYFTYDAQNRLINSTSYDYNYNYSYDAAGRLTGYEGASYTAYASNHPHAVTDVGGSGRYAYDANGNLITRWTPSLNGWQTLTWDHENHLASVTGAGTDTNYSYDPDGQRVKAATAIDSTYYLFPHYEVNVVNGTGSSTKYYTFGGLRLAVRQHPNALMYLYQDHLGSTIYATHDGGTPISDQRYFPYGRKRSGGTLPTDHKFTGQKYSDANGLYYYGARYYDP